MTAAIVIAIGVTSLLVLVGLLVGELLLRADFGPRARPPSAYEGSYRLPSHPPLSTLQMFPSEPGDLILLQVEPGSPIEMIEGTLAYLRAALPADRHVIVAERGHITRITKRQLLAGWMPDRDVTELGP